MNYQEVTIFCDPVDPVVGLLYSLDISGLVIKDKEDFQEFFSHKSTAWDYIDDDLIKKEEIQQTCLQFYLTTDEEGDKKLAQVKDALVEYQNQNHCIVRIAVSLFREEDWSDNWKQYFKPYEIGDHIVVKPEWETYDNRDGRVVIELDPGSAFGTGRHETTRMCIEALDKYARGKSNLLDVGTGSGILSIAAIKLGMIQALAIDIDDLAVETAQENVEKSGLSDCIKVKKGDLLSGIGGTYDVITANIIADAIISLSGAVSSVLKEDGVFICSGIINTREEEVKAALLSCHLAITERKSAGDWICFVCQKN